jgi:opacity protein-like surface antigen
MNLKTLLLVGICLGLLSTVSAAQEETFNLKVVTEQANIREEPDIGSPILHMAAQGTLLEAEAKEGEWYRVRFINDRGRAATGFVHESLVIETPRPSERIPPVKVKTKPPEKTEDILPPPKTKTREAPPPQIETPPDVSPAAPFRPPLRVSVTGALSHRAVGDLNEGAQGLADYYENILQSDPEDSINALHLAYAFGAEIQAELFPRFFLGFGLSYYTGGKESGVLFPGGEEAASYTSRPKIKALPLTVSAAYYVHPQVYLKGGLEYYFSSCRYSYRFQRGEFWEEWEGKATSSGFGFLAGVGAEMDIAANLTLFAEAAGHFADFSDFEGTNLYQDSEGNDSEEDGKLYLYQAHVTEQDAYPLVFIRRRPPGEADVSNPRLAGVDWSGLTLRVGLSYRF